MATLKRVEGWDINLVTVTNAMSSRPHIWGDNDCAIFAANAIEAMTGADLMAKIRGRYSTAIGAARVIKNDGFESLADYVSSLLPEISLHDAKRGDLIMCDGPQGEFLAIKERRYAIGPGVLGVEAVRKSQFRKAWKVG